MALRQQLRADRVVPHKQMCARGFRGTIYQEACCIKILHDSSHMACIDGVTQPYSWATQSATQTMPAKYWFRRFFAIQVALLVSIFPSPPPAKRMPPACSESLFGF